MDHSRSTKIEEIFTAEAIAKSGVAYSRIFGIKKLAGNASIQIEVTGDGIAKIEWVASNDEDALVAAFIVPNNANDIVTAFTKTDGPGGAGKHIYPFNIKLSGRGAVKVTETSATDAITITATLAVQ